MNTFVVFVLFRLPDRNGFLLRKRFQKTNKVCGILSRSIDSNAEVNIGMFFSKFFEGLGEFGISLPGFFKVKSREGLDPIGSQERHMVTIACGINTDANYSSFHRAPLVKVWKVMSVLRLNFDLGIPRDKRSSRKL